MAVPPEIYTFIHAATFSCLTNVNFDDERFKVGKQGLTEEPGVDTWRRCCCCCSRRLAAGMRRAHGCRRRRPPARVPTRAALLPSMLPTLCRSMCSMRTS